jgi:hypothetical protein
MWELEDWKDLSKMLENFAEAAFAIAGTVILSRWLSKNRR